MRTTPEDRPAADRLIEMAERAGEVFEDVHQELVALATEGER